MLSSRAFPVCRARNLTSSVLLPSHCQTSITKCHHTFGTSLPQQRSLAPQQHIQSRGSVTVNLFPFDTAWNPNVAAQVNEDHRVTMFLRRCSTSHQRRPSFLQSIAPQLFAVSLFPYLAFLYYLTKSGKAPKLTVIGFWFLLAFVGATIPAGIYGKMGNHADKQTIWLARASCHAWCSMRPQHNIGSDTASGWCIAWPSTNSALTNGKSVCTHGYGSLSSLVCHILLCLLLRIS